jgi:hypothetical protein
MFDKCKYPPVMDTLWIMLAVPMYEQTLADYLGEGDYKHTTVERDNSGKPTKLIGLTLNMQAETAPCATLEENVHRCDSLMPNIERSWKARKAIHSAARGGTHEFETDER